jgi:hypothetical protein
VVICGLARSRPEVFVSAKKKLKPVELPPRRSRNVTAAKAVNQKAGPFKRKPEKVYDEFDEHGYRILVIRDGDLPNGWWGGE